MSLRGVKRRKQSFYCFVRLLRFARNDQSPHNNCLGVYNMKNSIAILIIISIATFVQAKIDLVTLPTRDTVQITIYNSADMTLVRESRALTLNEGKNSLQFSWANTLI